MIGKVGADMNGYPQNGPQQPYQAGATQPYSPGPSMGNTHPIPRPYASAASENGASRVTAHSGYVPVARVQNPQAQQYQQPTEDRSLKGYIRSRQILPLIALVISLAYCLYVLIWVLARLLSGGVSSTMMNAAMETALMKGILMPHIIVTLLATVAVLYAYHTDLLWLWMLATVLLVLAILLLLNQVWGLFIPAVLCAGLSIQGFFGGRKKEES